MIKKRVATTKVLLITTVSLVAAASPAWSAPPLTTDDAGTLAPGTCQLEIEQRRFGSRVERDIVPVCNIWFDAEFGIGHQRVAPVAAPRADSIVYQFKKVFLAGDVSDWAFAAAAATVRAMGNASGTRQNFVNAIASRQIGDNTLHFNIGVLSDRETPPGMRRNRLTWAIAAENDTIERWTFVGEVFGQRAMPATAQIGLRWWALPKYVQFTTSLGAQRGAGRDGRWLSFGVRFETGDAIF